MFYFSAGRRDKASRKIGRMRPNLPIKIDAVCPDLGNMLCRLCQQRIREGSAVAVLVCGHIYHADCLELRTQNEDKRDPPCPLCIASAVDN